MIHSSCSRYFILHGITDGLESISAVCGREAGHTLNHTETNNHEQSLTLTPLDCGGKLKLPGRNPIRHRDNIQTPHRKAAAQLGIDCRDLLLWGNSANHGTTPNHMKMFQHVGRIRRRLTNFTIKIEMPLSSDDCDVRQLQLIILDF